MAWFKGRFTGRRLAREMRGAPGGEAVERVLRESESEILRVQRSTGWDTYWKVYAWLAPLR
jgi:hypothetical protein